MPLSEEELRIFAQIEAQYSSDESAGAKPDDPEVHRVPQRRQSIRPYLVGFPVALAASIYLLGVHVALAFAACFVTFVLGVRIWTYFWSGEWVATHVESARRGLSESLKSRFGPPRS